jgi:tetratricopeptide (TPR) repeat protein
MTVSSAAGEETSNQFSRARLSRANAFRVLCLSADVELKKISRQHLRLLVALELGEQGGTTQYGLQPLTNVSEEEILEAVHLLERPQDRLIEELFWVNEMDGLVDGHRHHVLDALRGRVSGTNGAVARHNLAVMLSVLGQECAENCRLDHWKEALKTWKELMDDDLFWTFMQGRARRIDCQKSDCAMMKAAVRRQLSSTFSEEMVRAVKTNELRAVPVLASLAIEHKSWLDFTAALKLLEQQEIKNGFVSLGAILDRISGITQQDNKADIRSSLVERERELRSVAGEYGDVVRSLGELADANAWFDAVARSYHRLSGAYLSLLGDLDHAIRLIVQAREFARDPQLLESMERDRQTVQRAILCRAADVLARGGDFAGAEQKLASALAISDEEQKTEIEATRDLYRRARESMERDKRHVQWVTLRREVDALVQWGDFAAAEQKLASALAMVTEEQKIEIKAMQDRYRWGRLLRGVDTTKKNPILYTLNGFGAMFYGKRDYDPETRSYVTNHWLTFLFLPVFPLGAYRVTDADFRSYYIHGKAPLPNFLKQARWAIGAPVIILVLVTFIGRGTSTKTVGAASTNANAIASARGEGGPEASPEKSSDAQHSERDDIEQERAVLTVLAQSLDDRKRKLDVEDTEIQKQNRYLASVRSSYAKENVPGGGQSTYQAVWAGYDRKVQKYNADLAAWKTDYAVYNERVTSLNARQ